MELGVESHSMTQDKSWSQPLKPAPSGHTHTGRAKAAWDGGEVELPLPATPLAGTTRTCRAPSAAAPLSQGSGGEESHGKRLRGGSQEGQEALRGKNKASEAGAAPEPLPFPPPAPGQGRAVQGSNVIYFLAAIRPLSGACAGAQAGANTITEIRRALLGAGQQLRARPLHW